MEKVEGITAGESQSDIEVVDTKGEYGQWTSKE